MSQQSASSIFTGSSSVFNPLPPPIVVPSVPIVQVPTIPANPNNFNIIPDMPYIYHVNNQMNPSSSSSITLKEGGLSPSDDNIISKTAIVLAIIGIIMIVFALIYALIYLSNNGGSRKTGRQVRVARRTAAV